MIESAAGRMRAAPGWCPPRGIDVYLEWRSAGARHLERVFWPLDGDRRDVPARLRAAGLDEAAARGVEPGRVDLPPDLVPGGTARPRRVEMALRALPPALSGAEPSRLVGRHLPAAVLGDDLPPGAAGARTFRVVASRDGRFTADFAHPLAGRALTLGVAPVPDVGATSEPGAGRDREAMDPLHALLDAPGPGMQAALGDGVAGWLDPYPLARADETDDALFYHQPRLVKHLDDAAVAQVECLYGALVAPGMRVLDLMTSWVSHVPPGLTDGPGAARIQGLGMNAEEMAANPQLSGYRVHDLNARPRLPYADRSFDAALCTVSFEYLTRPLEVSAEVLRVLRPGGAWTNVWSERWFPPKVVAPWTELHPFERLGLVCDVYRRAGFTDLQTLSLRGLPRPHRDPYRAHSPFSDPIYAVYGRRPG